LKLSVLRTVLGSTRYHCKELYITPILRCIIFYMLSKEGTSVYTCEGGLKCFVTFVLYWEAVSIYQGQVWSLDSHVLLSQDRGNSTSLWGTEGLPDAKPWSQCFCFGGSSRNRPLGVLDHFCFWVYLQPFIVYGRFRQITKVPTIQAGCACTIPPS
jgi:hypothetical protein